MRFCVLILVICAMVAASCSRKIYVPVETATVRTDTLRITNVRIDSIVQRDSVAVVERGDTVYYTRWRDRICYRDRTDTVYSVRVDSVRSETVAPMEKSMSWWQRVKSEMGGVAIGACALLVFMVVWRIVKRD